METYLPAASGATILIVDDSQESLLVLSKMLDAYGYQVLAEDHGASAISTAKAHPPDLIMLDINMPEMDGYETCRLLKADERTRSIPVIFISAMAGVEDKVKAFQAGGVDYVAKPFQIEEVLARLETHLSLRRLQSQLEAANQELASRLVELDRSREAEREQRILAEALRDTIAAINSTLNYEEVLDLMLENLARVVPHDAANIALVDEDGNVQITRARGYKQRGLEEMILSFKESLAAFPIFQQMVADQRPVVIPNISQRTDWRPTTATEWIRSFACAPIIINRKVIGMLNLDSAEPGFFTQAHSERLQAFANQAAVAIEKARLFEQTQLLAITDDLTGLFNRRHVLELAEHEFLHARRYQRYLSATMLDIDHFKRINDRYGHPIGDQALLHLANSCRKNLRSVDILGRYGGEEFLVMMPETAHTEAMGVAERIRAYVEATSLVTENGPIQMTISLGVATLEPGSNLSLEALIINADNALYAAKAAGRNRVRG